jgi:hypothetical protein
MGVAGAVSKKVKPEDILVGSRKLASWLSSSGDTH